MGGVETVPPKFINIKTEKMNICKFLNVENREGEISPIYHCEINRGDNDKAIIIKKTYEGKYPQPYLINGECMFCRPGCIMSDCPFFE